MINDASVVIGGGNWGIKEADVLGYKLINDEYYARDIDFANSTAAGTYTDSTGVVRKAPYNLLQYSEQFENADWSKQNLTISANVIDAPNGTLTADKIIPSTLLAFHPLSQARTVISGTIYSFSIYAKAGEYNFLLINTVLGSSSGNVGPLFNLSNGTLIGSLGGNTYNAQIVSVGNGWYRISFTFTTNATSAKIDVNTFPTSTIATYSGDGTSGAFLWGAQLVEGTEALPYFPTTTRLNVPRIDYRNADGSLSTTGRLLLEPQRTNGIRNSSMVGAVAPSTLPTNWVTVTGGLSQTVVGTGTENGLPYIDLRLFGTASSSEALVANEGGNTIAATSGQTWSSAIYAKTIAAPTAPNTTNLRVAEITTGGVIVVRQLTPVTLTSTLQRFTSTRTLNGGATVAFVNGGLVFELTNGETYDFTIRIAAPQMELGAYPTTWIPTTTAAVTRNADTASRTGVSSWIGQTEGSIFINVNFNPLSTNRDIIYLGDSSNAFRIVFSAGNAITVGVRTASTSVNYIFTGALAAGTYKIGFGYKSGDHVLYINGTQAGVSTSTSMPVGTLSSINLGNPIINGPIEQPLAQAALFKTRLTNEQLEQLTTI